MADQEFKAAQAAWMNIVAGAETALLESKTLQQLQQGAALLLRVARADERPEARIVVAWLESMGLSTSLGLAALEVEGL
ncbi:hypothetical protein [Comamonas composti]|uniref:hypothetical protein n=1 Tax=Comamonas composti TaxID=408558 RepID=UPI0004059EAA|nr:hypothetical protein [Comamonas composti]